MMNHNLTGLFAVGLLGAFCSCQQQSAAKIVGTVSPASAIETGVHWAAPTDFAQLKRLGHQFAVVSLDRDPDHWREVFDMADQAGIRLIAGLHPYPYKVNAAGEWEIELVGQQFIKYAQTRAPLVKALFVFNEPIWVDPATGRNTPCGALPAAQLRALRTRIHQIWPRALIYHDFGRPSLWAPGGSMERDNPCVGARYADVSEVADYAGIWFYPVSASDGYRREEILRAMREEMAYVTRAMRAEPIVLGQAFRCARCTDGTRLPSFDELRDLNCTLRWLAPQGISWYPWRQPAYEDSLASHEELWRATGPGACPEGRGGGS